mmetsp:Transcript_2339/g.6133  ORF Transcript_2339/g.6133 Transcript_2339/m.6133 type:complete len:180 (+) Transcript_2339:251-790(+)
MMQTHSYMMNDAARTSMDSMSSLSSSGSLPPRSHHQHRSRSRRRPREQPPCVIENSKSWRVNLDGALHDITAYWEGMLGGHLVILVDGEFHCACTRQSIRPQYYDDDEFVFGRCIVDGHNLELLPTTEDLSIAESDMELTVDGYEALGYEVVNDAYHAKARDWAHLIAGKTPLSIVVGK